MPTLDVILTQTTSRADAEAGRLPRPGQQPGRRRARQEHAPARGAVRPAAAGRPPASRRGTLRAQSPRAAAGAAGARGHQHARRNRHRQPRDHARRRANGRCRAARKRSSATWRWRAWPPRSTCARSATPSGRRASSSRPARRNTRGPATCASGSTASSASATSTIPDEARRRHLAGQVVISVAIRRDGTVERADIIKSSGIPLLDASALRIARLAEPYPPLPQDRGEPRHPARHAHLELPAGRRS